MNILPTSTLFLVCKVPVPGRCKTRLHPLVGSDGAAQLARAFLCDLIINMSNLENTTKKVLLYAPKEDHHEMEKILIETKCENEWTLQSMEFSNLSGKDLGPPLSAALSSAASTSVVFIGMDTPHLTRIEVQRCLNVIQDKNEKKAYITKANDGGYVLLGLPLETSPTIFNHGEWSTEQTATVQIETIQKEGFHVEVSKNIFFDIDTPYDVHALITLLKDKKANIPLPNTTMALEKLQLLTSSSSSTN